MSESVPEFKNLAKNLQHTRKKFSEEKTACTIIRYLILHAVELFCGFTPELQSEMVVTQKRYSAVLNKFNLHAVCFL